MNLEYVEGFCIANAHSATGNVVHCPVASVLKVFQTHLLADKDREHPQLSPVHIKTEIAELQQIFAHLDFRLYRWVAARPA